MKKNVTLKAKETKATNSDFYNLFRPIAPSINIIGKVAQIVSALTEAVTVWYITQSEMAGSSKFISISISIIAMILVIGVLELGGRKFLQVLTRAIVWKRLENAWYIALFSIVTAVTIGMGVLSFNLSTNGVHHAFVSSVPTVSQFDNADLKAEYQATIQSIKQQFESDIERIKSHHDERVSGLKDQYQATINLTQLKIDQYHQKFISGEKWAKSQKDKYAKKQGTLVTEQTMAISKLQDQFSKKLEGAQKNRDKAIANERMRLDQETQKGELLLSKSHGHQSKKANFWGSLFSFFVGFSVILAFVCIISVEVYRRGSGIEVTFEEEEKDQSIIELFWFGLTTRFENFFRKRVEKFAKISIPHRTGNRIGFNPHRNLITNEHQADFINQADDQTIE